MAKQNEHAPAIAAPPKIGTQATRQGSDDSPIQNDLNTASINNGQGQIEEEAIQQQSDHLDGSNNTHPGLRHHQARKRAKGRGHITTNELDKSRDMNRFSGYEGGKSTNNGGSSNGVSVSKLPGQGNGSGNGSYCDVGDVAIIVPGSFSSVPLNAAATATVLPSTTLPFKKRHLESCEPAVAEAKTCKIKKSRHRSSDQDPLKSSNAKLTGSIVTTRRWRAFSHSSSSPTSSLSTGSLCRPSSSKSKRKNKSNNTRRLSKHRPDQHDHTHVPNKMSSSGVPTTRKRKTSSASLTTTTCDTPSQETIPSTIATALEDTNKTSKKQHLESSSTATPINTSSGNDQRLHSSTGEAEPVGIENTNQNMPPPSSPKPNQSRQLRPAPYYYYIDHSQDGDESPSTPVWHPLRVPSFVIKVRRFDSFFYAILCLYIEIISYTNSIFF